MNAPREEWPLPSETPEWWRDRPLTPAEQDALAEEYAKGQTAPDDDDTPAVDAAGTYIGD